MESHFQGMLPYGWEDSSTGKCMGTPGNGAINTRPWRQIRRLLRRHVCSQKYWNFLDISIRGRDSDLSIYHVRSRPCKGDYKRTVLGSQRKSECVDRL
ncbi:hypothetical protein AVEN_199870-1 [Araneus ventricosus]|uniref:Uncharacterized protein n=1 Tax=Araneus ventricosus TaxID=182803 RepID=A0A4Y2D1S8_ARAVE|nr:hypothetical protein AVEN_192681-1 [Araneus ventricosus]GBM10076.1 hypothetical protein AVEN_199870-1 [Araneus ventricosus]